MKQFEKYELLQFVLWYYLDCNEDGGINNLVDRKTYHIGLVKAKGREIKAIWNKLLWFRDEARNRERIEEGENDNISDNR